ncbi:Mevalonate kinase [Salegentibacter echinorum]|uniref:Mevalonate kinase n=1 Tax=Salegentibacter echinorum TaxID=1073325 RepID=A0A1M5EF66_SALEC|nr:GYDIA family GHMP kinase [Salegentibacter echinorum]SHF77711.1 Mevalonate kinase [Salegentibacter echinorum]
MKFHSNGKLLITGEYAVLDGAKGLALPTKQGQSLEVKNNNSNKLNWKSLDEAGELWFEGNFEFAAGNFKLLNEGNEVGKRLEKLLQEAHQLNPEIFNEQQGFDVVTRLDFNRDWGLGTSSTLVNNLANWFKIDAYRLLKKTFGGSGYDIAAAQHKQPITYQITSSGPSILKTDFNPGFSNEIFFVYLNEKKNSRNAIKHYRELPQSNKNGLIDKTSALTQQFIACETLTEFELLINVHETLIAKTLQLPKIKQVRFSDFPGAIKSLGAWGGDFILVTGNKEEVFQYFNQKGFHTIFEYNKLIF